MNKLFLISVLAILTSQLFAQNIGEDLRRVVRLAPQARQAATEATNPALDTIVLVLAYYGGMPHEKRVEELFSGPALLAHYRDNAAIREFLLNEKLDKLLEGYLPPEGLALPPSFAPASRAAFLQKLPGAELFSRNGKVDLGKIRQVFTSPPSDDFSLRAAANAAATSPAGLSTANLASNALAGLSDWISRRAQEELTYTFLTKLREDINRNDLDELFPKTSQFLPTLDLLNYKAILPSIRKAFTEDLNAIAYNFGNYLEARDMATFRDPIVYNVFLIYRILDLEMREVPLADILAFTYGELERARIDTRCQIDLRMAKADTTNGNYQSILAAFDEYIKANEQLNRQFQKANDLLSEQFFNPIMDAVDSGNMGEDGPAFIQRAADQFLPLDTERLPLRNNYWETAADPPATGIVRAWLRGQEAYEYYEAYPSLTRFDELFGPDAVAFNPNERRAAGLTAVREILAHRSDLNAYRKQFSRLLAARENLLNLRAEITEKQQRSELAKRSSADKKADLLVDIAKEESYSPHPALRLLRKLTEEIQPNLPASGKQLAATRQRLEEWVKERGDRSSPYWKKMASGPALAANLPPLQQAIDATDAAYDLLHDAVTQYSSSQADSLIRSYHNLTTFETVFGMAQETFFLLSGSNSDLFLDKKDMSVFQTNASARQLLNGIGQERIGRIPNLGKLNAPGISDFLLDFGLYLSDLRSGGRAPDLKGVDPQAVRRILAVSFISRTLSALLEAPVFQDLAGSASGATLAERFPAFSKVPEVSEELNELFRLSQTGEFRYAVDNLLNLLRLFEVAPTASKKQQRLTARRDQLSELIDDYVVERDEDLRAVGLAAPSAKLLKLPVKVSEKDRVRIMAYESEATNGISTYDRAEAAEGILNLKIQRIREELNLVERRLARLNPQRINKFRESLFRYGTFMADVAGANDASDFEAALNTVALPVGSSQIKRTRPSSVELGAYFGGALSRERLILPAGVTDASLEEDAFGAALWVPVGVSYSKNIGGGKSITLFGSLLDLGAITAFRLEKQNEVAGSAKVERLPVFRPANVIAPGLHLLYNFPKSPFSLGIGVQDGPSVREFTTAGSNRVREARSVRGMLTFSVDVPIFRFFNQ
ncbi:hypothetical protein [Neolewinella agarilytica]|uniref:Uncharacterized protein n=1 Tax=Neolewinella agarilytica TaxID=478744 RepID=A0A1H9APD0_9BACT|nr:hypothetical protein [Neolewinella agarilytica]SEP78519.1 hypothetical protein SAMN05444359_102175 [Neolewinella agarilytica]